VNILDLVEAARRLRPDVGFYTDDKTVYWEDSADIQPTADDIAAAAANRAIIEQIVALEKSIDTPRMRREFGLALNTLIADRTPAQMATLQTAKDVQAQIDVLRGQLT